MYINVPQLHHPVELRAARIVQHVLSPAVDAALVTTSLTIPDDVVRALGEA